MSALENMYGEKADNDKLDEIRSNYNLLKRDSESDLEQAHFSDGIRYNSQIKLPCFDNFDKFYKIPYERKEEKAKDIESIVSRQGEIFERYVRTGDKTGLYENVRQLSEKLLDMPYEGLPQNEQIIIDVLYHYLYGIEKFLEAQSEEIL